MSKTDWSTDRSVVVPVDAASKAGIASDQVKVSSKYGGGYVANVEGLHQLHCLVSTPIDKSLSRRAKQYTESASSSIMVQL